MNASEMLSFACQDMTFDSFLEQSQALLSHGEKIRSNLPEYADRSNVRTEKYGTFSILHRGTLCPSPIYDIVIGNAHRGRIMKHPGDMSKIRFIYHFDSQNELLFTELFQDGEVFGTEYLLKNGDERIGVEITCDAGLQRISREEWKDGKLFRYTLGEFSRCERPETCTVLHQETYGYGPDGLLYADFQDFRPSFAWMYPTSYDYTIAENSLFRQHHAIHLVYVFEHCDGYLSQYHVEVVRNMEIRPDRGDTFPIRVRRKI